MFQPWVTKTEYLFALSLQIKQTSDENEIVYLCVRIMTWYNTKFPKPTSLIL